ncbi:hypothetical protein [Rhodopirellula europaea]|uniref:hypothetical protein n=1 Tax=Rhodopirellula europaea TaxID=1263866 RepID=UPI0030EB13B1
MKDPSAAELAPLRPPFDVCVENSSKSVNIYVYPVPHYFFQWTSEIVQHLAEHGVSPDDFEAIVMDDASEVTFSRSSGRPARIGVTDDGRVLFCVFDWVDGAQTEVEPRTAFEIGN